MLLEGELGVADGQSQLTVVAVGLEAGAADHASVLVLHHLVPMASHDVGQGQVDTVPAGAFQQVFQRFRVLLLGVGHASLRPCVQGVADVLAGNLALAGVQLVGPFADAFLALAVGIGVVAVLAHLEVGVAHRHCREALHQTFHEIGGCVLLGKRVVSSRVDTVEVNVVLSHGRVAGLEEAACGLVVHTLQEERLGVHVALLLLRQVVIELAVELAHVERPLPLPLNHLHGVELGFAYGSSTGLRGQAAQDALGAWRLVLVAAAVLVALGVPAVQGVNLHGVGLLHGLHHQSVEVYGDVLARP